MTVVQRIAHYINEQGMRPKQFADAAGISRQMLSNWLREDQIPSPDSFQKVLKAMTKLPKKEREKLKKDHSMAWKEATERKRKRDGQKTELLARDRISKLYRVEYDVSVWLREIGDPSRIPEMEKKDMRDISGMRFLARLKEDKRLIEQLGMKEDEHLLESYASLFLFPLQQGLPGFHWSLWLRLSAETLKSEKTPVYFSIMQSGKNASAKSDADFIAAIRTIGMTLKIHPRHVAAALQDLTLKSVRDALATVDAKQEEDDAVLIPRKLGTKVLSSLGLVTDLDAGVLQWPPEKLVPFLVEVREVTRKFLLAYVKNDAEHEIADLLFDHLRTSFPKI